MTQALTKKDFESDQEVRWCPGCGDYSVLAAVQRFLPSLGLAPDQYVFVSGIGCSSRFPYYMDTYGFHTIHGRAPAVATGVKCANPDLSVWMITGDGDALSIGGNHMLHLLRRNVDLQVLLFNNQIYGLTKGQYSPTSEVGKVTKSTPSGSLDYPVNPLSFVLGAQASFVARTLDVDAKHMTEMLRQANDHRGTSFVEIYQNCNIFNDKTFASFSERAARDEQQVQLVNGELVVFGKEKNRGIRLSNLTPEIVEFESGNFEEAEAKGVIRYDTSSQVLAGIFARLPYPQFPKPMGVFYQEARPTFDGVLTEKVAEAKSSTQGKSADEVLSELYASGDTWEVR